MFRTNQMAVYIHWPFCKSKCPYCDFNVHVRGAFDQSAWLDAYVRALEYYARALPEKQIVSVFFGGGTPSLMMPETVGGIIDAVQRLWPVVNDLEITLEANPTSVEIEKFQDFKAAGVNRVSLGVQALNDSDLSFLGRTHSASEALKAIEIAGDVFDRFSFDLMYGRPDQSLQDWECELRRAAGLARGHLSLYQLTIERTTPFYLRHARGEFSIPDEAQGADFYHLTQDVLEAAGMPAYEVSNHAAAGQECRHNLVYWHMADYIGVGAGAHGRFIASDGAKYATRDHSAPDIWMERVLKNGHGAHEWEQLSEDDVYAEKLMMGLRLHEGLDIDPSGIDMDKLAKAVAQGWCVYDAPRLRLSREGMLRLNALIPYLLL